MIRAASFAAFLLSASAAYATTYYVDPVNGVDNYGGSAPSRTGLSVATAWKQHYFALTRVAPGDTVCLLNNGPHKHFSMNNVWTYAPGTTDRFTTSNLGTSSQRITWGAATSTASFNTSGSDPFNLSLTGARPIIYDDYGTTLAMQIKNNNTGSRRRQHRRASALHGLHRHLIPGDQRAEQPDERAPLRGFRQQQRGSPVL